MDQIGPLRQMRERLVGKRREQAQAGKDSEVARVQGEIDAIDRAIADEEKIEKQRNSPEPRIRHV